MRKLTWIILLALCSTAYAQHQTDWNKWRAARENRKALKRERLAAARQLKIQREEQRIQAYQSLQKRIRSQVTLQMLATQARYTPRWAFSPACAHYRTSIYSIY